MEKLVHIIKNYWKSLLISSIIFYISIIRSSPFQLPPFPYQDKLIHFIMYFSLTAVFFYDTKQGKNKVKNAVLILIALVIPICYGACIELLQDAYFYPRTASWLDFLANTTGSITAFLLMHFLFFKKQ